MGQRIFEFVETADNRVSNGLKLSVFEAITSEVFMMYALIGVAIALCWGWYMSVGMMGKPWESHQVDVVFLLFFLMWTLSAPLMIPWFASGYISRLIFARKTHGGTRCTCCGNFAMESARVPTWREGVSQTVYRCQHCGCCFLSKADMYWRRIKTEEYLPLQQGARRQGNKPENEQNETE
jgi:hypothetical protein